ncbi:MAG: biotin/lipoate A/B protein ligase family protein [Pirellulaceae bacterium]
MQLLDLTLDDPVANVALEEALLNEAESKEEPTELLRLWHLDVPMVVIGRSSSFEGEVNENLTSRDEVPVVRRCSGGAAIVCGTGCLMYSVILSYQNHPELQQISHAHDFVLTTVSNAVNKLGIESVRQGTSDLTVGTQKISGNSLRCKRKHILYHGTLLCHYDLELVSRYLETAPRQPEYRQQRNHDQFVANLNVDMEALRESLIDTWGATQARLEIPTAMVESLLEDRYRCDQWNRHGRMA